MPLPLNPNQAPPKIDWGVFIAEPDCAMSVLAILQRHVSGTPFDTAAGDDSSSVEHTDDGSKDYFPDDVMFDALTSRVRRMDMTEIDEMRAALNSRARELRSQFDSIVSSENKKPFDNEQAKENTDLHQSTSQGDL